MNNNSGTVDVSEAFWSFVFLCKDYIDDSIFQTQEFDIFRNAVIQQQLFYMSYDSLFITQMHEHFFTLDGIDIMSDGILFHNLCYLFENTPILVEDVELRYVIQKTHNMILQYLQDQEDFSSLENLKL
jgi:hypothetical protein